MYVAQRFVAECETVAQNQKKRRLEVDNKIAEKKRIVAQISQKIQDMNRYEMNVCVR
jgi:hypothetical protein